MLYFDHNATTPLDPQVLNAMMPYLTEHFANPASQHYKWGKESWMALENSRKTVSDLLNAGDPESIIFTSGATESNNLAIKGLFFKRFEPFHIITQKTEHKCVLESIKFLEKAGCTATYLDVNEEGLVAVDDVKNAITDKTRLVSLMWANNEVGAIQPIHDVGELLSNYKDVFFHVDAAQAVGKISVDIQKAKIDLLSFSAHKIYGPKGVGALYIPKKLRPYLESVQSGGSQEQGLRSGTVNLSSVVGLAKSLEISVSSMNSERARLAGLCKNIESEILNQLDHVFLNGPKIDERLPGNLNFSFLGAKSEDYMLKMPQVACSSGSACASGSTEPSYVIQAMASKERASSSLRFGFGRGTSESEVDLFLKELIKAVHSVRSKSLEYEMLHSL